MRWAVQAAPLHRASMLLVFVVDQLRRAPYFGRAGCIAMAQGRR
jgi:hypothetical protein